MAFIGRKNEISKLTSFVSSKGTGIALIYGRRRIGKTEIIKQILSMTKTTDILYISKQTSEKNNVESLCTLISDKFSIPVPAFNRFEEVLEYLFKESKKKEIIFAIDEYPFLRRVINGLDSIIQSLYEKYHDDSNLKLILCGSYIDVMKSLLEKENPLYGRFSLVLDIKQQDYYESSLYYPTFSDEDKVALYSVFGGVPFYNSKIDSKLSVRENIISLISSTGSQLENEVSLFLKGEISKVEWSNEVFEAMCSGNVKFNDILSNSHVPSSPTLADTLSRLTDMEIIDKEAPINDESNKKKAKYLVTDNLTSFYYRYIFPNLSQRENMSKEDFYNEFIEKDFQEKFIPKKFETIFKQFLIIKNKEGKIKPVIQKIGRYYYDDPKTRTNGEFDVVTFDNKGYAFYEAKYKSKPMSKEDIDEEIDQVNKTGLDSYKYGFLSKSGFKSGITEKNLILYTLKDLYSIN